MVADMGNTPEMIVAVERTLNAYILLVLPILSPDFQHLQASGKHLMGSFTKEQAESVDGESPWPGSHMPSCNVSGWSSQLLTRASGQAPRSAS
jgi:hypothetical protein